jgi:hypothetical protein
MKVSRIGCVKSNWKVRVLARWTAHKTGQGLKLGRLSRAYMGRRSSGVGPCFPGGRERPAGRFCRQLPNLQDGARAGKKDDATRSPRWKLRSPGLHITSGLRAQPSSRAARGGVWRGGGGLLIGSVSITRSGHALISSCRARLIDCPSARSQCDLSAFRWSNSPVGGRSCRVARRMEGRARACVSCDEHDALRGRCRRAPGWRGVPEGHAFIVGDCPSGFL